LFGYGGDRANPQEKHMNASTSSASADHFARSLDSEKSLSGTSDVEKDVMEQTTPKHSPQVANDVERIRSSIARLTSSSMDGLEGLTTELQELQKILASEVERVQGEIESAMSGIKIIMEAIAPWKSISPVPPTRTTAFFSSRNGLK
jgi:hypothetical protein